MRFLNKIYPNFKRNDELREENIQIELPEPIIIRNYIRYMEKNENLIDSGISVYDGLWFELDGCMEWNSIRIKILTEKNEPGKTIYLAHQHARNNWEWDFNWKTEDDKLMKKVTKILLDFKNNLTKKIES